MSLITLLDAHLAYGDKPLLDGARFALQAGERVGLIGRNGTGKSTLLKVIAGALQLDDGELQRVLGGDQLVEAHLPRGQRSPGLRGQAVVGVRPPLADALEDHGGDDTRRRDRPSAM